MLHVVLKILWTLGLPFLIVALRREYAAHVRTIFYFYSLSFAISFLVLLWAVHVGAINCSACGAPNFSNTVEGQLLRTIQQGIVDLNADMMIVGAVIWVLVAPQLLTYFLGALFGCASQPWLVGWGYRIFVWAVVKSFAVTAGICTTWLVVGVYSGDVELAFTALTSAGSFLGLSVAVIYCYQLAPEIATRLLERVPLPIKDKIVRFHGWARRHDQPAS